MNIKSLLTPLLVTLFWTASEGQTEIKVDRDTLKLEAILCATCFSEVESLDAEILQMKLILETKSIAEDTSERYISSLRDANNALLGMVKKLEDNFDIVKRKSWIKGFLTGCGTLALFLLSLVII